MNKKIEAIWNDPVGSKVISVGLIALITTVSGIIMNYYYSWWPAFFEGIKRLPFKSIPIWLIVLVLLLVPTLLFLKTLFAPKKELNEYYSVPEAARKLQVGEEQLYKWGATGKIILSVIRNDPSHYQETRIEKDEKGREVKITRIRSPWISIRREAPPPVNIAYIHSEDTASIILNDTEHRQILINRLFPTRDLKKGTLLVNSAIAVTKDKLIITASELERFKKNFSAEIRQERKESKRNQ